MILVVDASVAVKWFVPFNAEEANVDRAVTILQHVGAGAVYLVQPPHFIAEVAAVLARIKPAKAVSDLVELLHIPQRLIESAEVYGTALELAKDFQHHLFETLYHAVALHTPGSTLVTADKVYFAKAKSRRQICLLEDYEFA